MLSKNNNNSHEYTVLKQFLGYMEKKYKSIDDIRFLAEGSFGKVYKAKCDGQNFAIKVQKGKISDAEKKLYDLMKKNKFQNLVNTIDYLEGTQFSYIMMEYCSRDLYHDIKNNKIEQSNIMYIVRQILKGIEELHQNNIIHRDLKPDNILIFEIKANNRTQLQYKIADFGTNFHSNNEQEDLARTLVGTPYYIAPEVGQDKKTYDLKADIWSLGVIIFELLLGEPPFNGSCIEDFQKQTRDQNQINAKLQYLYSKKEFYNYKLIDIVKQTLNQDPKQRPSIQEIVQILQPVISKSVEKKTFITQDQFKQKSITIHQDFETIHQNQQNNQGYYQNGSIILNKNSNNIQYFNQEQPQANQISSLSNNSRSQEPKIIQVNQQIISKSPQPASQLNKQIKQTTQIKFSELQNMKAPTQHNQKINFQNPQIRQKPPNQIDPKNIILNKGSQISTNQSDIQKPQNQSQISIKNYTQKSFNPQQINNPKPKILNQSQKK